MTGGLFPRNAAGTANIDNCKAFDAATIFFCYDVEKDHQWFKLVTLVVLSRRRKRERVFHPVLRHSKTQLAVSLDAFKHQTGSPPKEASTHRTEA